MAIAEHHVDATLVARGSTSVCGQRWPAEENDSSNEAVSNRHHVGRDGHLRFFHRSIAMNVWKEGAVQTKGVGTIPNRLHAINIITIATKKYVPVVHR